jgi:hypothetical protein
MKFVTSCLLFSLLLFACRKERISPDEVRLLKTTQSGPDGSKININFEYDNQGRIVHITRDIDNTNKKLIATISYNGNEVILVDTSENSPGSKIATTLKFLLDNENKPLQRIQIETWQFSDPEFEQRNFINDTTYYQYNSEGLLTQSREQNRDSVWSIRYAYITPATQISLKSITRTFQNSNGNIVSISGAGTRFYKVTNENGALIKNSTIEELISFDYASGFKNQMDFKNAFIIAEYGRFYSFSILNPGSRNIPLYSFLSPKTRSIPSKRTFSHIERDGTGSIRFSHQDSVNYKAFYNRYGFLSGVATQYSVNPEIILTYNK